MQKHNITQEAILSSSTIRNIFEDLSGKDGNLDKELAKQLVISLFQEFSITIKAEEIQELIDLCTEANKNITKEEFKLFIAKKLPNGK